MAATTNVATAPAKRLDAETQRERVLVITRLLAAPPSLVFKMWTEPAHMVRWWGCSRNKAATVTEHDLRPGGRWRVVMRLEDGTEHRVGGVYRELSPPERLAFTWAWEDADGILGHETVVTVTLAEKAQMTEMTLHHALFETTEMRDLHGEGWTASLDRLAAYLATPAQS
ncbi:MAG TPA: SRPBCC domain-containing protein [Rhodospirillales bacterium]